MSIYSASVKRPVTTILVFVAVMVMGLYSLVQLPVDLYPQMELPFVAVFSTYPGASASGHGGNPRFLAVGRWIRCCICHSSEKCYQYR